MPTIRIDDEVWRALQQRARPFQDKPNDVLRRMLGLEPPSKGTEKSMEPIRQPAATGSRRTPQQVFRRPILEALVGLGGSAEVRKVMDRVHERLKDVLTAFDRQDIRSGMVRWEKTANWERLVMVQDGLIQSGTSRGIWTITEKGRDYLNDDRQR